ncbi:MAG: T9SS type A sorting domain-containing protein [Crocinitomicaceae bacterium]|nr:T9SS type A sorting domain-containing protein [Crocinitomicaceae bacterium]
MRVIILIFGISLSVNGFNQSPTPWIYSSEIIPTQPIPNDSVYLIMHIGYPSLPVWLVNDSVYIDQNNIVVQACYSVGAATSPGERIDTFNLGVFTQGAYEVIYYGQSGPCDSTAGNYDTLNFVVGFSNIGSEYDNEIKMKFNPVSETHVELIDFQKIIGNSFFIYDLNGRIFTSGIIPNSGQILAPDKSGLYIIHVSTDSGILSKKIMVNR